MPDLPRPTVDVSTPPPDAVTGRHEIDVTISRDGKARTYKGSAGTSTEAIKEVIGKILNDPVSAEFIPRG